MFFPYLITAYVLITVTLQNVWKFETPNGESCVLKIEKRTVDDKVVRYKLGKNSMVLAQDCLFDPADNYTISPLLENISMQRCADTCYLNPLCWHFVWSSSDQSCRLKEKVPTSVKADKTSGFSCGARTRQPEWQPTDVGAWWSSNCNFGQVGAWETVPPHPLDQSVRIRCIDLCVQDPQCNHFSFSDGYCTLKNLTDPNTLPSKGKAGDICGRFRMENAGGHIQFQE